MNVFKRQCINLRTKGHTLSEITKITGRGKTSVYYHIRAIPLSKTRWAVIKKTQGIHIRKFALARKGKSQRHFTPFDVWDKEKVLLVAHLMFDGEITRGKCIYNNRSKSLIDRVERCMKHLYAFAPKRYHNSHTGVSRICYFNVALASFIKTRAETLLWEVFKLPQEQKREFIRAFFDDEGSIDFRSQKNIRRIRGYQKNVVILYIIKNLLAHFAIKSSVQVPNEVVISGKENLEKFMKEINFSKGVRINGNRSNSIWKESLEKREILRRAIQSFKT